MPKQARINAIKSYRCYTPSEAAALVGVSTRTIRNWSKDGLRLLDTAHPPLIRGDDLRNHITAQRQNRKVPTAICEFYCLRCRARRNPAAGMADCKITGNKAMLTALCDVCETIVCKPVSLARLPEIRKYARQLSEKTLDREIAALERFDIWNGRKDFARFHIEQAMGFRTYLETGKTPAGNPLGKSTMRAILATMREFILWLSQQEGFRSRIKAADADYFNLSRRDEAEARAAQRRPAPSINQAKHALSIMPNETPVQIRDKAIFALLCLKGVRVGALITLKIKHVDLVEKSVTQNPREVDTKFGKSIDTFFAKGFDEAETALAEWITYLDEKALYGQTIPCSHQQQSSQIQTWGFLKMALISDIGKAQNPYAKS